MVLYLKNIFLVSTQKGRNKRTILSNLKREIAATNNPGELLYINTVCAKLPFTAVDISEALQNNKVTFYDYTDTPHTITLPDGSYNTLSEIQSGLEQQVLLIGNERFYEVISGQIKYAFELGSNIADQTIYIDFNVVPNKIKQVNLNPGGAGLGNVIGFPNVLYDGPSFSFIQKSTKPIKLGTKSYLPRLDIGIYPRSYVNEKVSNALCLINTNHNSIPGGVITYPLPIQEADSINLPFNTDFKRLELRITDFDEKDYEFMAGDVFILLSLYKYRTMNDWSVLPLTSIFLSSDNEDVGTRDMIVNIGSETIDLPTDGNNYAVLQNCRIPYSFATMTYAYKNNFIEIAGITYDLLEHNPQGLMLTSVAAYESLIHALLEDITAQNIAGKKYVEEIAGIRFYLINFETNLATQQVILDVRQPAGTTIDLATVKLNPNGNGIGNDLGFFEDTIYFDQLVPSPDPVLLNDLINNGILVQTTGDLRVDSESNIFVDSLIGTVLITNNDLPGQNIIAPSSGYRMPYCSIVGTSRMNQIGLRFLSPARPDQDLVFLSGQASASIKFYTAY